MLGEMALPQGPPQRGVVSVLQHSEPYTCLLFSRYVVSDSF